MIRDFFDIKGQQTLQQEIRSIKDEVASGVWAAIEGVRKIGAIGAHMEEDVNLIIDIEPEEANKLIWLIEFLIESWYIRRHDDEKKLEEIPEIVAQKEDQKRKNADGGTEINEHSGFLAVISRIRWLRLLAIPLSAGIQ